MVYTKCTGSLISEDIFEPLDETDPDISFSKNESEHASDSSSSEKESKNENSAEHNSALEELSQHLQVQLLQIF
jgi:hypothetical protein